MSFSIFRLITRNRALLHEEHGEPATIPSTLHDCSPFAYRNHARLQTIAIPYSRSIYRNHIIAILFHAANGSKLSYSSLPGSGTLPRHFRSTCTSFSGSQPQAIAKANTQTSSRVLLAAIPSIPSTGTDPPLQQRDSQEDRAYCRLHI